MLIGSIWISLLPIINVLLQCLLLACIAFRPRLFKKSCLFIPRQRCMSRRDNVPRIWLGFEPPLATWHPVHFPGPEVASTRTVLISSALSLAELLYKLFFRHAATSGPGIFGHYARVFSNDSLYRATVDDRALFAIELTTFGVDFLNDFLRWLLLVGVCESPVEVRIDDDWSLRMLSIDRVLPKRVFNRFIQVPSVGYDDRDTGIDSRYSGDSIIIPLVHARRIPVSFIDKLYASNIESRSGLVSDKLSTTCSQGTVEVRVPKLSAASIRTRMLLCICATWKCMEIEQNTDRALS